MSQAIVPSTVLPLGPQFQRLPNELLLEIFKFAVKLPPAFKIGSVINKKIFEILVNFGPFARIRKVCKAFSALAIQSFYETNEFSFKPLSPVFHFNAVSNCLSAQVPWAGARHFLRRINITIYMEDSYKILTPTEAAKPPHARRYHNQPITSVEELITHCPGTVQLLNLTNAISGFSSLHHLNLRIRTIVRVHNIGRWLDVLKELGIVLRAREVVMDIRTMANEFNQFELWHPLLQQVITIDRVVVAGVV